MLADRKPRRLVLIGVELVRCSMFAALTALVVVDAAPIAVYVLAVLVVVAEPLFRSAQAALTPALVSTPEELTAANVLASGVESVGLFLGPALGALLLAATGVALVFGATAGLLVVAILLVARIGVAGEPSPETGDTGRVRSLLAGWRTIAEDPGLRVVVGLFSLQTLVAGMFNVLVVVLAIEVLDLGTPGVGLLDGVVGIGAVAGSFSLRASPGRNRLATSFGVGLMLWGVPLALVAATSEIALVVLLLVLVGIGNTLVDVTGITLLQRSAPDAVLGRVFGAFEALIIMTMGIGSLLAPDLRRLGGDPWRSSRGRPDPARSPCSRCGGRSCESTRPPGRRPRRSSCWAASRCSRRFRRRSSSGSRSRSWTSRSGPERPCSPRATAATAST